MQKISTKYCVLLFMLCSNGLLGQLIVSPDTSICFGDSVTLNAQGGINYSWYPIQYFKDNHSSSVTFLPKYSTTIGVEATDNLGQKYKKEIKIHVKNIPLNLYCNNNQLNSYGGMTYTIRKLYVDSKGNNIAIGYNGSQCFISKFRNNSHTWTKTFGGSSVLSFVENENHEYIFTGRDLSMNFILKLNSNGGLIWGKQVNMQGSELDGIFKDNSDYYAVGSSGLSKKGIIVKFSDNGNMLWAKKYSYIDNNSFRNIIRLNKDYFLVCGEIKGIAPLASYFHKMDSSGNVIQSFGIPVGTDFFAANEVLQNIKGDIFAVGGFFSNDNILTIHKLDTNLQCVMTKSVQLNSHVFTFGAQLSPEGYLRIGGTYNGNLFYCDLDENLNLKRQKFFTGPLVAANDHFSSGFSFAPDSALFFAYPSATDFHTMRLDKSNENNLCMPISDQFVINDVSFQVVNVSSTSSNNFSTSNFNPVIQDIQPPISTTCGCVMPVISGDCNPVQAPELLQTPNEILDIQWSGPLAVSDSNSLRPFISTSGIYTLSILTPCGWVKDSFQVVMTNTNIFPPTGPSQLCEGETFNVSASQNYPAMTWVGPNGFQMNGSQFSIPNITSNQAGTYHWQIQQGNCLIEDSIVLHVQTIIQPNIQVIQTCGLSVNLSTSNTGTYLWNFGDGITSNLQNPVHNYAQSGQYTIKLTVGVGTNCQSTDSVLVRVLENPKLTIIVSSESCEPIFIVSLPDTFTQIRWYVQAQVLQGSQQIIQLTTDNQIIKAVYQLSNGCLDSVETTLHTGLLTLSDFWIPNVFSPNGDNLNDNFSFPYMASCLKNMTIYDRWGTKVIQTQDFINGWDGKFHGKDAPEGVYVYVIESQKMTRTGTVTLIR